MKKIMSKLSKEEVIEKMKHLLNEEYKENFQLKSRLESTQKEMQRVGGKLVGIGNKKI